MTFAIHKSGGTNAGRRRIREVKREPWTCECNNSGPETTLANPPTFKMNDPRLTRCGTCGIRRP